MSAVQIVAVVAFALVTAGSATAIIKAMRLAYWRGDDNEVHAYRVRLVVVLALAGTCIMILIVGPMPAPAVPTPTPSPTGCAEIITETDDPALFGACVPWEQGG
jgi:hypothetical protein